MKVHDISIPMPSNYLQTYFFIIYNYNEYLFGAIPNGEN